MGFDILTFGLEVATFISEAEEKKRISWQET